MLQKKMIYTKPKIYLLVISVLLFMSSCYTYRIGTTAQAGTESTTVKANTYFWGLIQNPKNGIPTPNCDSLNINGMAEVQVKTNFGNALITVVTLGIWCPMKITWKCAKPCQKIDSL